MLVPVRTVAPAVKPLTLLEAKAHLRVDHSDEDELIDGLIAAATAQIEGMGRALVNQTWTVKIPEFPGSGSVIGLPLLPVQSISAITYYDTAGVSQTLASSVYALLTDHLGAYVSLQVGQSWPSAYAREDAATITFVAGYGADGSAVPGDIIQAILQMVGFWYERRDAGAALPRTIDDMLLNYRRFWLV